MGTKQDSTVVKVGPSAYNILKAFKRGYSLRQTARHLNVSYDFVKIRARKFRDTGLIGAGHEDGTRKVNIDLRKVKIINH